MNTIGKDGQTEQERMDAYDILKEALGDLRRIHERDLVREDSSTIAGSFQHIIDHFQLSMEIKRLSVEIDAELARLRVLRRFRLARDSP